MLLNGHKVKNIRIPPCVICNIHTVPLSLKLVELTNAKKSSTSSLVVMSWTVVPFDRYPYMLIQDNVSLARLTDS